MGELIDLNEYKKKKEKKEPILRLTRAKLAELLAKYGHWGKDKDEEKKD